MSYIDNEINFDDSNKEKYEYIRRMQDAKIKDSDILIPIVSDRTVGDRNLIELINATEFISRYPHLFH